MIALKKIALTLTSLLFLLPSIAQEKGDLGIIFSNSRNASLAIEYRKPVSEKFNFKIAATYGDRSQFYRFNSNEIISVSDSAVVSRNLYQSGFQTGIRVGGERQFGNSMFTIGADLSLDYRRRNSFYHKNEVFLQQDGSWGYMPPQDFDYSIVEPLNASISRHYLVPGARLNANMDIPIGRCFLLNLSAAGIFSIPIYMGETQKHDPNNEFIQIQSSTIDLNTNLGIGLRYIIGSRNKKRG